MKFVSRQAVQSIGHVLVGMDVVDAIAMVPTERRQVPWPPGWYFDDVPVQDVLVERVYIPEPFTVLLLGLGGSVLLRRGALS